MTPNEGLKAQMIPIGHNCNLLGKKTCQAQLNAYAATNNNPTLVNFNSGRAANGIKAIVNIIPKPNIQQISLYKPIFNTIPVTQAATFLYRIDHFIGFCCWQLTEVLAL